MSQEPVTRGKDSGETISENPLSKVMYKTQQLLSHDSPSITTPSFSSSCIPFLCGERDSGGERRRRSKVMSLIHNSEIVTRRRKRVNSFSAMQRNFTNSELAVRVMPPPTISFPLLSRVSQCCSSRRRHHSAPRSLRSKPHKKRNICMILSTHSERGAHDTEADEEVARLSRALESHSLSRSVSPANKLTSSSSSPDTSLTESSIRTLDDLPSQATLYSAHIQPILQHAEALLQSLDSEELSVPAPPSHQLPQTQPQTQTQKNEKILQSQQGEPHLHSLHSVFLPRCVAPDPIAMLCGEILKDASPSSTTTTTTTTTTTSSSSSSSSSSTSTSTLLPTTTTTTTAADISNSPLPSNSVSHNNNGKSSVPPLRTPSKSLPRFITSKEANRIRLVHSPRPTPTRSLSTSHLLPSPHSSGFTAATKMTLSSSTPPSNVVSTTSSTFPKSSLNFTPSPRSAFSSPRRQLSCCGTTTTTTTTIITLPTVAEASASTSQLTSSSTPSSLTSNTSTSTSQ